MELFYLLLLVPGPHIFAGGVYVSTVLVVDDIGQVRRLLRGILEGAGHVVHEAENGLAAYDRVQALRGDLDLLVTDIVMPEIDGMELARRVSAEYPAVAILYISGYADSLPSDHPLLMKPFAPSALIKEAERLLAASGRLYRTAESDEPRGQESQIRVRLADAKAKLNAVNREVKHLTGIGQMRRIQTVPQHGLTH